MKETNKLHLILGSHAHVPSGAAESEFNFVYENKLRPFISNLYRYSNITAVLHYSGVLLYWIERTHPEFFMLIEDMVSRKQAEILGGGFYEPMLPLIPLQDRIGQIELMTTYLRRHFGRRPLGCWIPGLAWEQHLAAALVASDMHYTFLSQDQFALAGLSGEELFFPCLTEDQGKLVTVFPVSVSTGNMLAKKSLSQVFSDMAKDMEENNFVSPGRIVAIFPEKPASSAKETPDTAWNRFFEELSLSNNIVETVLPGKIIKTIRPNKKASFPNSSLIADGFSPRRFLIDNYEANGIYSKMIFTNVLISQLKGDKSRKQNAREELWKAQDSCFFSPGDGVRCHKLRKAAYSSLLRAERLSKEKTKIVSSLIQHDFDFDGIKEYLFQHAKINCYIQLKGAAIFELDYLPKEWNYIDCGSAGSERRTSFADVIIPADTDIKDLEKSYPKKSRFCFREQFEALSQDRKGKCCFRLPASDAGVPFSSLEIQKCFSLKKDILTISYVVKNTGKQQVSFCLSSEINFSFAGNDEKFARFYTVDSSGKDVPAEKFLDNAESLKILDVENEVQLQLASVKQFSGCLVPVFDGGLYQSNKIITLFPIALESAETWVNEFSLKFSH